MSSQSQDDPFTLRRIKMVEEQLESRGIRDRTILEVFKKMPRHLFVKEQYLEMAYEDSPLPIGLDQTISQPFIVAYMTEQLKIQNTDTILEIGTGSGYQTAILAELGGRVYTLEIIRDLARQAETNLKDRGYKNIYAKRGDGYQGWPEYAPFDAIILTAAPPGKVPEPLLDQLDDGGRLIAPIGEEHQQLLLIVRQGSRFSRRSLLPVRFVPMVGKVQES